VKLVFTARCGRGFGEATEAEMKVVGIIAAYAVAAGTVFLMAFCAWFAAVWGFNPLVLVPLYFLGLIVFLICIATAIALTKSKPSPK
jgi:hypothetical protein